MLEVAKIGSKGQKLVFSNKNTGQATKFAIMALVLLSHCMERITCWTIFKNRMAAQIVGLQCSKNKGI